jgi:membrane protease YdiL (CAAX protease family)
MIPQLWRGQLFLFDKPLARTWSSSQGYRLLAVFLILELGLRPLLRKGHWPQLAAMAVLTAVAFLLAAAVAKVRPPEFGLHRWSRWSPAEKFYFPQILAVSLAIFCAANWADLKGLWDRRDLWGIAAMVLVAQIVWGFYQELLYRGLLQAELVRRWGAGAGVAASNLVFTFGPLHFYHFAQARAHPTHLWIFAAIFAIGLYFAVAFHRSGNLWIVGILHGLGDFFIDGLAQIR